MIHIPVIVGSAIAGWLFNENEKHKKRLEAAEKELLRLQLAEVQRKLEEMQSQEPPSR